MINVEIGLGEARFYFNPEYTPISIALGPLKSINQVWPYSRLSPETAAQECEHTEEGDRAEGGGFGNYTDRINSCSAFFVIT